MITKGLRAVIIVNAEDLLWELTAAITKKIDPANSRLVDTYRQIVVIRSIEKIGLAQVSRHCKGHFVPDDRLVGWVDALADDSAKGIWYLFSQLGLNGWFWIDDLKIVGGRELWLCWTK